jgi:hypothetical protein
MAFSAALHLDRLEETIAEFRRALAQPLLVPIRVISTDQYGVSTMELLQEDLPFGSPFFSKTKVFDHPNVHSVRFLRWPVPHFLIVGTVDGVMSAIRRRYTYFIQYHAIALFKQESADSLVFCDPIPRHQRDLQLLPSLRDVPDLEPATHPVSPHQCGARHSPDTSTSLLRSPEPLPWQPTVRSAVPADSQITAPDYDDWDSEPDVVDPIPPINFRPYDATIDGHLYQAPTPPPINGTTQTTDLLTPTNPPKLPVDHELPCRPSDPTDPPTSSPSGTEPFVKLKNRFFKLFK